MEHTSTPQTQTDNVEVSLRTIAQYLNAFTFGLLPLFFIPLAAAPFDYSKTLFVIGGVLLAIIFYSLSVLRSGTLKLSAPLALFALWGIAATALLSALFSGDMSDAFIGDVIGAQTAVFLTLLALVATVTVVVGQSKASIIRLYLTLTFSSLVLTAFHVGRLFFGNDFLSFGVLTNVVSSPVGGWNDLALLFGLIVLLALIALEQLPLTRVGKILFSSVVALSLVMLAVVNFFAIWIVLGLVSLVVLMYSLTKDRFTKSLAPSVQKNISLASILLSACVFIVSLIFIVGGSTVGTLVSNATNISYVEVRPSLEATVAIGRQVYQENAFVGIGTNRFADAWRQYKDPAINQTIFWDTEFNSGSGYIPTLFITTGLLGAICWVVFLLLFLRAGYRMLFTSASGDSFWYFIGSSSFAAATYLWGMSLVYVPGPTIVLLAGIFTSISFVAYTAMIPTKSIGISVADNRRAGIVLVAFVMVVIVAASSALYFVGRHYSSVYAFNDAVRSIGDGVSVEVIEERIAAAYSTAPNDRFVREIAEYQIAKMNTLLTVAEPTAEQQAQFQQAAATGINAAQIAIEDDRTNPRNHAVLGTLYSILAGAGVEGAKERADEALRTAVSLDPTNPVYPLLRAQLASRTNDLPTARTIALESIALKPNFTDALLFLSQVDIAAGDVENAIASTRAVVSLEPNNPARYYQLGVLFSAQADTEEAIAAFSRAVALDPDYANARYFLALAYIDAGNTEAGIRELEIVRDLNSDNAVVQTLIDRLAAGETVEGLSSLNGGVAEPATVSEDDATVSTTELPDTSLVSPVNVVPDTSDETKGEEVELDENSDAVIPTT